MVSAPTHERMDRDPAGKLALYGSNDQIVPIFVHELRSHLAPIKNASELLQRSTLNPATTQQAAAIIERQVDGLSRLVDALLASAQSKGLLLRRTTVTVSSLIVRSVQIVEPLVSARRQTLSIRLPPDSIRVAADEMWLEQALQNVIGNAVKYTDPGGRIEVDVKCDGPDVVISVRDSGVGLAAAELETVFDLYKQIAQSPTRPPVGGFGVGLNVAACVVEAHGGSIRATSEGLGRGSTFVIRLPSAE
jgi:signal transduction histidine kinase